MKKLHFVAIALACCVFLSAPPSASAIASSQAKPAAYRPPGANFAHAISVLTGVAISPLLGTSAYGAVMYYRAPEEQRPNLPWFAQPLFWVPALLLIVVCFVKDTAGTALPTVLKKPLDVAETVENKISGLVATGAFVPLIVAALNDTAPPSAMIGSMGFAAVNLSWLYDILMTPVAMVAFFLVFLASNAINILILLSPFTTVDAALKSFRLFILGTVCGSAWLNPWIGAVWALILIVISYFIAGWSFRLSHFGLVFVWEFITRRCRRFTPDKALNWMFLGRKINKVPPRSYGKFFQDEKGAFIFKYRPWLVLAERTLALPEGKYAVGKGLFYSEIMREDGNDLRSAMLLPPRYRSHESELVAIYGLTGVRDTGLRAAWKWLRNSLGFKPQPQAAAA